MSSMSSSSLSATGGASSSRPSAYPTKTLSQPLMSMFSTSRSSSSGWRRPTPKRAAWIAPAIRSSSSAVGGTLPSLICRVAWSSSTWTMSERAK